MDPIKDPQLILWMDLETTGYPSNHVIEVGCIITDLNFAIQNTMTGTIALPTPNARLNCDPVVEEMHSKSGLWDDLENPTWFNYRQADDAMYAFCNNTVDQWLDDLRKQGLREYSDSLTNYTLRLAGSGVSHFDAPLIAQFFPYTWSGIHGFNALTKPTLDLGVLRRFFKVIDFPVGSPNAPEDMPHRALDDLYVILAQARYYKAYLHDLHNYAFSHEKKPKETGEG